MKRWTCLSAVLVLAAVFFAVSPLRADITGTILGVVTDPSGAAIPGAPVSLRNSSTGLNRQATTDSTGSYEFLAVPIGSDYSVEVEAAGFRKSTQTGITLQVDQRFRADFRLVVGTLTQSVKVSAAAAQVETTSTQLGDVIESGKMENLPLNGRSYLDLLGLQAGVVPITSNIEPVDRTVSGTITDAGFFSVNGEREATNAFLVNGGDVEEGRLNGAEVIPTLDSLQEFRLLTNTFDAEYGRFAGGIINAVTKSGTNGLHGTLFEFLRNSDLDSRNFFELNQYSPSGQEEPGTARGSFQQNQFGAAVGGPIIKNRMFFFSDYQGTRQVLGVVSGEITVPSASERNGDFSDFATTGYPELTGSVRGDNIPGSGSMDEVLTSRLGYTVVSGEPYWVSGCNTVANAQAGMCVFPGQVIPQAAWGPVAKNTLKFFPTAVATPGGVPIYSTSAYKQVVRDDKIGERIDLNGGRTGNWSYYQHFDDSTLNSPFSVYGANVPGFPAETLTRAQQFNLGNTRNFGAAAVNEARLNFTRMALHLGEPKGGQGSLSSFGFVVGGLGIIPVDPGPPLEGMPPLCLHLLNDCIGMPGERTFQFNNTWQALDNFSIVHGRHTMKFGGEFRYLQINDRGGGNGNGNFGFSGSETENDFADYLLGAPDSAVQQSDLAMDTRTKYGAAYGQDTYKMKPNFTLNYGLRWEFSQPFYDTQGKIQAFIPGENSVVFPGAPTGWLFPGDPGVPSTLAYTHYDNLGPRLGLAYSPGFTDGVLGKIFGGPGKTSIRAGSGIYYTAIEDLTLFYEVADAPFGLFFPIPGLMYLDEPYKSRISPGGAGQRFPWSLPQRDTTINWAQYLPISGSPGVQTTNRLPYAEHLNFTIQRELARSTILSIGYVGSRGHRLYTGVDFNPGSATKCEAINAQLALTNPGATPCGPFGEDVIYNLGNGANANGTRPYSVTSGHSLNLGELDFGDNAWYSAMANSSYNSLQMSLQRQVGAFTFLGAYTYSKSLDNASGMGDATNPFDYRDSKALSGYDMADNFVFSYNYTLPLERLMRASSGPLRKLLQGWQVSGITRFTTGLPITMGESDDHSLCGGCGGSVDFPNYNNQPIQFFNPRASANHQYFSTSQFSGEAIGVGGDASRRFFHGPGLNNWDLAAHKVTNISERLKLEFRAEFFNVFNHTQFANPSGNIAGSTFGRVTTANNPRIRQMAMKFYF